MKAVRSPWRVAALVLAALSVVGCTGTQEMTPQQREGVEMRRYCEKNPNDVAKCNGFLGWM